MLDEPPHVVLLEVARLRLHLQVLVQDFESREQRFGRESTRAMRRRFPVDPLARVFVNQVLEFALPTLKVA